MGTGWVWVSGWRGGLIVSVGCGLRFGREGSGNGLWAKVELMGIGQEEEETGWIAVGNSEPKVLGIIVEGCGPNMDVGGNMVEGCGPKRDL